MTHELVLPEWDEERIVRNKASIKMGEVNMREPSRYGPWT